MVVGGKKLNLTVMEFRLLTYLLNNAGATVTRTDLYDYCGMQHLYSMSRPVDTLICRLRKKLGKAAYSIKTVHGVGYRLEQ